MYNKLNYVVYLLEVSFLDKKHINTIYKIGYSSNLRRRVKTLFKNSTKEVFSIKCIGYIPMPTKDDARLLETSLHDNYRKYVYTDKQNLLPNGNTELFNFTLSKVKEIKQLNKFCSSDSLPKKSRPMFNTVKVTQPTKTLADNYSFE